MASWSHLEESAPNWSYILWQKKGLNMGERQITGKQAQIKVFWLHTWDLLTLVDIFIGGSATEYMMMCTLTTKRSQSQRSQIRCVKTVDTTLNKKHELIVWNWLELKKICTVWRLLYAIIFVIFHITCFFSSKLMLWELEEKFH